MAKMLNDLSYMQRARSIEPVCYPPFSLITYGTLCVKIVKIILVCMMRALLAASASLNNESITTITWVCSDQARASGGLAV